MSGVFEVTGSEGRFAFLPPRLANRWSPQFLLGRGGQAYVVAVRDELGGGWGALKGMWWNQRMLSDPSTASQKLNITRKSLGDGAHAVAQVGQYAQGVPLLLDRFSRRSPTREHLNQLTGEDALDDEVFYVYALIGSSTPGAPKTLAVEIQQRAEVGRRFSERELMDIARQLTSTLAVLHKPRSVTVDGKHEHEHFVHNDLKPENILMVGDPKSYILIDFDGCTRVSSSPGMKPSGDREFHTPAYAPPGELLHKEPVDARFDVYSLAATLYHLASLSAPSVELRYTLYGNQQNRGKAVEVVAALGYGPILTRVICDAMSSPERRLRSAQVVSRELGPAERALDLTSVLQ